MFLKCIIQVNYDKKFIAQNTNEVGRVLIETLMFRIHKCVCVCVNGICMYALDVGLPSYALITLSHIIGYSFHWLRRSFRPVYQSFIMHVYCMRVYALRKNHHHSKYVKKKKICCCVV